jgi:integrase
MPRVTQPRHGNFFRVWGDRIDGVFRVDGRRRFRTLGKLAELERTPAGRMRTELQLSQAVRPLWEAKRAELEQELGPEGSARPVLQVMRDWIAVSRAERRPGTVELYEALRAAWQRAVGDHPMGVLTLGEVDRFKLWMSRRQLAPATINLHLRTLRAFLHWAQERGHLARVPRIRLLEARSEAPKALTDAQLEELFAFLAARRRKAKAPRRRREYANAELAVWLAAYTGLRSAAIRTLKRARVDLVKRVLYPETEGRLGSRTKRTVATIVQAPLLERIRSHLAAFPDEVYLLDDGSGGPAYATKHVLTRAIARAMDKALGEAAKGIKPIHGFRAYRARTLREAGADLELIRDMLAHSDIRVTAGYFPDPAGAQWEIIRKLEQATADQEPINEECHGS